MDPISGIVQSVTLTPGRPDSVGVLFEGESGSGHLLNAAEGEVYCDGERSDPTDFFDFLIVSKYPVRATLYPCAERYGTAMKAEFSS